MLTVESSQQNAITQNFNPYIQSSAATLLGATSLDVRAAAPSQRDQARPVLRLAGHRIHWSNGGKSITFTIRPGREVVKRHADDRGRRRLHLQHDQAVPRRQQHRALGRERELERQPGDDQLRLASVRQPPEHRRPDLHRPGIDLEQGRRPGQVHGPEPGRDWSVHRLAVQPAGDHAEGQSEYWGGKPAVSPRCSSRPTRRPTPRWRRYRPISCTGRATSSRASTDIRRRSLRPPGVVPAGTDQQPRAEPEQVPDQSARRAQGDQPGDRPDRDQPAGGRRTRAAGFQRQWSDAADLPAVPVANSVANRPCRHTQTSPQPSRCSSRRAT